MIQLRQYQRESIDAIHAYWAQGGGNPLIELATGTGKSILIAVLMRELIEAYPNMRVIQLVHVRELVQQNCLALLRYWPQAPIGINSAGLGRRDRHSQILFASIQSVYKLGCDALGPRDLVIIDEAHLTPRSGEGMYLTFLEKLRDRVPDLRVAGFTATPYRLDSGRLDQGEGRLFDEIVYTYGLAEGVRDKWLSPLVSKATAHEINVAGVARRGGEFIAGELEAAANIDAIVNGACDEIVERGQDRKSWLCFCAGVTHAAHVRDALKARGIAAETVTGETPTHERDRFIKAFKAGDIRCLTSMGVLTTGFDAPRVDLIADLRPTLSTGLFVQIAGRGTRIAGGKTDCLYLDFSGNVRRHGPVDAISVSGRPQKDGEKETAVKPESVRAKVCPECETYNGLAALTCVCCGHEWPKPKPKHTAKPDFSMPIMASQGPAWIPVDDVGYYRHEKLGANPSLRVEYRCGLQTYREWVTLEHGGFAGAKAQSWWRSMGGRVHPYPPSIDEAIKRTNELHQVTAVTLAKDGKFWRVTGWRVVRPSGQTVEIDDKFRIKPITNPGQSPLIRQATESLISA